ncbi:MFS transporter [Streptomyces hebeiensis]|uniref:MFS transporter n=1 Tax=Streptomyces hebeiensis TaxID=229486 RepID=A0ABN1UL68_9ACTN
MIDDTLSSAEPGSPGPESSAPPHTPPHPRGPVSPSVQERPGTPEASGPPAAAVNPRRVAFASFIGNAIELYDFFLYGMAAALVFGEVFFPDLSPLNATLAAFSTHAVAFLARPIGSVPVGHFGDRVGRKSVLVASLLLMGLSTALVGLLPGYATLGDWAPVLLVLLRLLQGLGIGGEWGGAVLLAVEHAPRGRRGLYAAFPQLGPPVGFAAATGVFWLLSSSLDDAAFTSWGWRVPFLLSFLLVAVGLVVRLKISETPVFARAVAQREASRAPVTELIRRHPRELLLGAGAMAVVYGLFYTSMTYGLSYTTTTLGVERDTMLALSLVACLFLAAGIWVAATRSDRQGRRRLILAGCGLATVWGLLLFPLLDTERPALIALALGGALFCVGVASGPMGAFLPELFHARVRYSGAALSYNLGGVLGGGLSPLVIPRLQTGLGSVSIGCYLSALAVLSLSCVLALPETRERELV